MAAIDECRDSINKTEQIVNEKFNMLPHPSEEDLKKHQFVLEALAQKRKQMRDWDLDVLKGKWRGISRSELNKICLLKIYVKLSIILEHYAHEILNN